KIERYSQGSAIDFYKSLQEEDVYVEVSGFKSYAHLFYTRKKPSANPDAYDKHWLLLGATDKPVYVVTKTHKALKFQAEHPDFSPLFDKGGFAFFVRKSNTNTANEEVEK